MLANNFAFDTTRLRIRFYNNNDFEKWQTLFSEMKDQQNEWDWDKEDRKDLSITRFKNKLKLHQSERNQDRLYYFCLEHESHLIGMCILNLIDRQIGNAELGFQISNLYWGKGYGKEVAQGVIEIAIKYLKLREVYAEVNPKNFVASGILLSLGFNNMGIQDSGRLLFVTSSQEYKNNYDNNPLAYFTA